MANANVLKQPREKQHKYTVIGIVRHSDGSAAHYNHVLATSREKAAELAKAAHEGFSYAVSYVFSGHAKPAE